MATKKIKKIKKVTKQTQKQKQKQNQTSKAIGNIVNINVPKPKRQYTRRQPSKTSQPSSTTSVVTQIHQLPIPQYPIQQYTELGTNNLKSAQLQGDLGIVRNNEINNQSPFSVGGNQDRKILTSADRANALMMNIASKQPENLLDILNKQDNIIVPSMKERPLRKLSPNRESSKPIDIPQKTFRQLEKQDKQQKQIEAGSTSIFDFLIPKHKKILRKVNTGDNSIFEPLLFDTSLEDHRKSLLKSMANHEAGLKQTSKNEDALYGYKKDGTPKKKTGKKSKLD